MKLIETKAYFKSLDLNNPEVIKTQLGEEKHTRLEGSCIESLFESDLLKVSKLEYSDNWWFLHYNNDIYLFKTAYLL